jgi:hypothetical protein
LGYGWLFLSFFSLKINGFMSENKLHLRIALLFELQKKGVALNLDQEFLIAAVL